MTVTGPPLPGGGEGRWTSADGKLVYSTHMAYDEPPYDADNPILRVRDEEMRRHRRELGLPDGLMKVLVTARAEIDTSLRFFTDDDGGQSAPYAIEYFLVIYDPTGGFVTGGGWIDSPAGAYRADPDLAGKVVGGYDFINGDADASDDEGHGTHVAGIVAAILGAAIWAGFRHLKLNEVAA